MHRRRGRRHDIRPHFLDLQSADARYARHGFLLYSVDHLPDGPVATVLVAESKHHRGSVHLRHLVTREIGAPAFKHRFRADLDAGLLEFRVLEHDPLQSLHGFLCCLVGRARLHLQQTAGLTHVGKRHHLRTDEVIEREADEHCSGDPREVREPVFAASSG